MIDHSFADHFAHEWIDAWNSHDLDRILRHYADDFTMSSPAIVAIAKEPSGTLTGKDAIRAYWAQGLALMPTLHFTLITTLVGIDSITLYYRSPRGLAAEVFHFDAQRTVIRAFAHYAES